MSTLNTTNQTTNQAVGAAAQNGSNSTIGDRISTILKEKNMKQVEFAHTIGVSSNYICLLVNQRKQAISEPLAKLIEETYGYSAEWILTGEGESHALSEASLIKRKLAKQIKYLDDAEARAVFAFINSLNDLGGLKQ